MDFAKIVKHEKGVTVLLTSASYQVLTGQIGLSVACASGFSLNTNTEYPLRRTAGAPHEKCRYAGAPDTTAVA